jgi:hypothetical protein
MSPWQELEIVLAVQMLQDFKLPTSSWRDSNIHYKGGTGVTDNYLDPGRMVVAAVLF